MDILGYDCVTAAGKNVHQLMAALYKGRDCSAPTSFGAGRLCSIHADQSKTYQQNLSHYFEDLWRSVFESLHLALKDEMKNSRVACVFASTKGFVEDYIWSSGSENIRPQQDPFHALVENFCQNHSEIPWALSCNISNACTSSHVAIEYIQDLFESDRIDFAVLIAADLIGPFIFKGFSSLKLMSLKENRPFASNRDGLQLGDAVSMLLFSKERKSSLRILKTASDTEGVSITRPSSHSQSLVRAIEKMNIEVQIHPDLVIAHGTGTQINDQAEDLALHSFLSKIKRSEIGVTNTKWCIGHSLGASGCVDLISACEILKSQKLFSIQNTLEQDPILKMKYLTSNSSQAPQENIRQILVSSLGFGGVHAALVVASEEVST